MFNKINAEKPKSVQMCTDTGAGVEPASAFFQNEVTDL